MYQSHQRMPAPVQISSQRHQQQLQQMHMPKPPLSRPVQAEVAHVQPHPYGENSNRGRIPLGPDNNNMSERKNPLVMFLGSMNASGDSANTGAVGQREYWQDISQHVVNNVLQEDNWPSSARNENSRRRLADNPRE